MSRRVYDERETTEQGGMNMIDHKISYLIWLNYILEVPMVITLLPDEQVQTHVSLSDLHSLADAHISGVDLVLRKLREAQVISLMMSDPATWPAILVTRTQEYGLLIIDGYHRREAARRRKLQTILTDIRAFASENDVIEAAFQANIGHGLPASAATRSDYAYWLFTTYPDLKQNEIARRVGIKPSTVNTAIRRRERERKAAEKKRQESSFWSKEALQEEAIKEARDKEIAQSIHAYVRQSKRLYTQLRRLDDEGERYWALERAIDEGDKVVLYRLMQYIEHYLKTSLPPDLVKSLKPAATRTRQTKPSASLETESSHSEDNQ